MFINPKQILEELNLNQDMNAADFGCGSGGWVIPLAKILKKGKVFAIDVQEEPLSALAGKAKLVGLENIKQIIADVETDMPVIRDASCDLVLLTNLLFQVDDKLSVLKQANRVLKQGAQLLIVDWKEKAELSPKQGILPKEQAISLAVSAGFKLEKQINAGEHHYCVLFVKA